MKKSKSKSTDIVTDNIGGFDVFRDVFYPKEIEIHLQELDLIYTVTDPLGIDRESVLLEVRKEDPGSIVCTDSGRIQITIPYTGTIQEFLNRLQMELEGMGYPPAKVAENSAMLNACRTTHIFCRPNCPPGRRTKQENRLVFPSARAARPEFSNVKRMPNYSYFLPSELSAGQTDQTGEQVGVPQCKGGYEKGF